MGWYLNTETTLFDLCCQADQRITGPRLADHGPQHSKLNHNPYFPVKLSKKVDNL
jgi:hypothetical protein